MIATTDYHTAGEPFRIVVEGTPDIPGATVRERRSAAQQSPDAERVRRLLCNEPRGHADMSAASSSRRTTTGPTSASCSGTRTAYSTARGHGTIALGAWAIESGRIDADPNGVTEVTIDVPSGRVVATVRSDSVTFRNVPAFMIARAVPAGDVLVDVSSGGAPYASVAAADLGLSVLPERISDLIAAGRAVKGALEGTQVAQHPEDERLSGIYGTIIYGDLGDTDAGPHQRNVTVFADGEVDRSPCGSGTSARIALLEADGRLEGGRVLTHDSIVGSTSGSCAAPRSLSSRARRR